MTFCFSLIALKKNIKFEKVEVFFILICLYLIDEFLLKKLKIKIKLFFLQFNFQHNLYIAYD
jgi:hypothetical protein